MSYPGTAGFKDQTTSKIAADKLNARQPGATKHNRMQAIVLDLYENGFVGTADDAAEQLSISPFSTRPRVTELRKLKLLERSHIVKQQGASRWALRSVRVRARP